MAVTSQAGALSVEPVERLAIDAPARATMAGDLLILDITVRSVGMRAAEDTALRIWGPGYSTFGERILALGTVHPAHPRRVTIRLRGRPTTFTQPVHLSARSSTTASEARTIPVGAVEDAPMDGDGLAYSGLVGMSRGSRTVW